MHRALVKLFRGSATVPCLLAVLTFGGARVSAEPVEYRIDPDHLSIGFLVDHIGYAAVLGHVPKGSGKLPLR